MSLSLKPTHATVKAYYETLHQFGQLYIDHEGAVRSAFQTLLAKCGQRSEPKLTLVPEYRIKRTKSSVIVDGALVDIFHLPHGYWEAKDEKDDLLKEVQNKLDKGYPSDNTIFQAPERAILYQGGTCIFDENISKPEALVSVVNQFFTYKAPRIDEWLKAVDEFSERVPELSQQVENLIKEERRRNPNFLRVFQDFYELCRQAINPNLTEEAVERMLVQHLLTERIFRRIFKNDEFRTRNVVAAEIEKVITELTKRSLNRDDFLKRLEPFYHAIERNAENATSYTEKQDFLNTVYMRFFQGYSPKEADTHGIVYTPQPIVNFMVRSVTPDYLPQGGSQCFPFYTYAEDGTHRRENITDWALEQFRAHYHASIAKWDIFHYIYAVLHHPEYRERYAANLRRELPRIPFASATGAEARGDETPDAGLKPGSSTVAPQNSGSDVEERRFSAALGSKKESRALAPVASDADVFHALVEAGKRLAEIHVHYEQQPEYKLTKTEKKGEKLDYRVKKMKLSKDKTTLIYNQFLTLSGIPKETYDYRLGNRSALEWVIDQYQVSTDKRSGITNDPNREDDPQYILRLIAQVITVSLETVKIVKQLPTLRIPEAAGGELAS